jgi:hypothetical protein
MRIIGWAIGIVLFCWATVSAFEGSDFEVRSG